MLSGVLFPAISLFIVALNARYSSIAGLIRSLHRELMQDTGNCSFTDLLQSELNVLFQRIELVKYALFSTGLSLALNIISVLSEILAPGIWQDYGLVGAIVALTAGIGFFIIETWLSTKALKMHLAGTMKASIAPVIVTDSAETRPS